MKAVGGRLVVAAAVVAPAVGPGAADGQGLDPKVDVSTTGNRSELVDTIPVTRNSGARKRVVVSMSPRELPFLAHRDRLELSSELQVTPDCRAQGPHCVAGPYRYTPVTTARLVLATRRSDTGGVGAVAISGRKRTRCPHDYDNFVHHCRIVFRKESLDIVGGRLPCRPADCRVNLVLSAHSRRARAGDRLIIGANGATGQVVQDKARLNAVRFSPGEPTVSAGADDDTTHSQAGLAPRAAHGRTVEAFAGPAPQRAAIGVEQGGRGRVAPPVRRAGQRAPAPGLGAASRHHLA